MSEQTDKQDQRTERVRSDGTARILEILAHDPCTDVGCRQCNEPALGVFAMEGCVAFPHDSVQALCPQHIDRASPLGGGHAVLLVDLSLDGAWSRQDGLTPTLDLARMDETLRQQIVEADLQGRVEPDLTGL